MPFEFRDEMIHDYRKEGYVIFRGILPPSLIRDLRQASARVPDLARKERGPNAQRLQPITNHLTGEELKPFRDYLTLPVLVDAIHQLLSPRHEMMNGGPAHVGLLIEPTEAPGSTPWHRDIRETSNVPDVEEFRRINPDPLWFNQINCPLYEDNCTWYVPGSYPRGFDLPGETTAAAATAGLDKKEYCERDRVHLEYCKNMPGAIRASMDAGDFMIYHPNGWHLGNYLPERKRVTIHNFAPTPELLEWYDRWGKAGKKAG